MKALIIGKGKVGMAVASLVEREGGETCFFTSRSDRATLPRLLRKANVCFLAIPTDTEGATACDYILEAVAADKPIVTCEKAALANHLEELFPYLSRIGFSATVGGGSDILSLIRTPCFDIRSITGVVNATLNFLICEVATGRSLEDAIADAREENLCEPGNADPAGIINAEVADMRFKSVILFNAAGLSSKPVRAKDFSYSCVSTRAIVNGRDSLLANAKTHRFAVTIRERVNGERIPLCMPGFSVVHNGWIISGGYLPLEKLDLRIVPKGRENALTVLFGNGDAVSRSGVGAGPLPTAAAMLSDATRLLQSSPTHLRL